MMNDELLQLGLLKPEDVAKELASAQKAQARTVLLRIVNRQGTQFVALPVGKA